MKKPLSDSPAAIRQRRRRQKLLEQNAVGVESVLTAEQGQKLDALLAIGYASDKSAALAKSIEEAYERQCPATSRARSRK